MKTLISDALATLMAPIILAGFVCACVKSAWWYGQDLFEEFLEWL